jgi:murein L,D-transpeptidase YafK
MWRGLLIALAACLLLTAAAAAWLHRAWMPLPVQEQLGLRTDISEVRARQTPLLTAALQNRGLEFGAPVFLRIFKEEAELELFVLGEGGFDLFRSYPICKYSGDLGPKLKEGDRQSPEGFYNVDLAALNPNSRFHLSFNLGFPNAYDRALGRSGSFLMVHGNCVSIGCYAMTDPAIEEIYVLVETALRNGQTSVPVHAFPFRMTPERLERAQAHQWYSFWSDLEPAYRAFETTQHLPDIKLENRSYVVLAPMPET